MKINWFAIFVGVWVAISDGGSWLEKISIGIFVALIAGISLLTSEVFLKYIDRKWSHRNWFYIEIGPTFPINDPPKRFLFFRKPIKFKVSSPDFQIFLRVQSRKGQALKFCKVRFMRPPSETKIHDIEVTDIQQLDENGNSVDNIRCPLEPEKNGGKKAIFKNEIEMGRRSVAFRIDANVHEFPMDIYVCFESDILHKDYKNIPCVVKCPIKIRRDGLDGGTG